MAFFCDDVTVFVDDVIKNQQKSVKIRSLVPKAIQIGSLIGERWLTPHFEGTIMYFEKNEAE